MAVFAHHFHAQGMEGADQHVIGCTADQPLGTLAHFGGGLVGEGDGGNLARRKACLNQSGNLVRDDARLAGARTCEHQARALRVVHCLQLGEIEACCHGAMKPCG
ncbi:hypothetical protein D3C72_1163320 [compost metagenome]